MLGEEEDEYVLCRTSEEHLSEFCKGRVSLSAPDGQGEGAVTMEKLPLVYLCRMSSHLASCLFHVNEVVLEVARALGNLTRLLHVLRGVEHRKAAPVLPLGHRSMEVVAAVATWSTSLHRRRRGIIC